MPQADVDAIKPLIVLWMTITTKVGDGAGLYLDTLANSATERGVLARELRLDQTVVDRFVTNACNATNKTAILTAQEAFHFLVTNTLTDSSYEGEGACPFTTAPILALLPR